MECGERSLGEKLLISWHLLGVILFGLGGLLLIALGIFDLWRWHWRGFFLIVFGFLLLLMAHFKILFAADVVSSSRTESIDGH